MRVSLASLLPGGFRLGSYLERLARDDHVARGQRYEAEDEAGEVGNVHVHLDVGWNVCLCVCVCIL